MRLVLPLGSTATGGVWSPKWPPLWSSVSAAWTVPSPPLMTSTLGSIAGDRPQRFADLVRVLDLIVEDVGVPVAIGADARQLGDVPGRAGVRNQRDAGA